uniref:Myosin-10-like protein isoform x3 n=1 Tax=Triatoma infestans TaxID=30076 RepID=A0A170ZF99_TRIIF
MAEEEAAPEASAGPAPAPEPSAGPAAGPATGPEACDVAQKAVTGASGRNLPKAMDNLSKAYNHSKTCKKCNETLGKFLGRYHSTTWCQVASR